MAGNPDSTGLDINLAGLAGKTLRRAVSTTSMRVGPFYEGGATILATTKCWVRTAVGEPVAVAPTLGGAGDHPIPANTLQRLVIPSGHSLAIVASDAGEAEITPGA